MADEGDDDLAAVTITLSAIHRGENGAVDRLFVLVYEDLRQRAGQMLRREQVDISLSATELVHNAYLRLHRVDQTWQSKAHFYNTAARAMRRILIERARAKKGPQSSGAYGKIAAEDVDIPDLTADIDIEALDEVLSDFERIDRRACEGVMLRYFCGCSVKEIAEIQQTNEKAVWRDSKAAQLWLHDRLKPD
jgi:RNA polymerase sigma factor (TIGR02999 family)